jgi:hypothetical protein
MVLALQDMTNDITTVNGANPSYVDLVASLKLEFEGGLTVT